MEHNDESFCPPFPRNGQIENDLDQTPHESFHSHFSLQQPIDCCTSPPIYSNQAADFLADDLFLTTCSPFEHTMPTDDSPFLFECPMSTLWLTTGQSPTESPVEEMTFPVSPGNSQDQLRGQQQTLSLPTGTPWPEQVWRSRSSTFRSLWPKDRESPFEGLLWSSRCSATEPLRANSGSSLSCLNLSSSQPGLLSPGAMIEFLSTASSEELVDVDKAYPAVPKESIPLKKEKSRKTSSSHGKAVRQTTRKSKCKPPAQSCKTGSQPASPAKAVRLDHCYRGNCPIVHPNGPPHLATHKLDGAKSHQRASTNRKVEAHRKFAPQSDDISCACKDSFRIQREKGAPVP